MTLILRAFSEETEGSFSRLERVSKQRSLYANDELGPREIVFCFAKARDIIR